MVDHPVLSIHAVKEEIWQASLRGRTSLDVPFAQMLSLVVDLSERQNHNADEIEDLEMQIDGLEAELANLEQLRERNKFLEAENARLTRLMQNQLVIPFKEG